MKTNKKGFTLIELLVVIAIIGILASVVLASLNSARAKSRDARRIADLKQLQLAAELYADANGQKYPTALSALTTGCSGGSACIATVPTPPAGTGEAAYAYSPTPANCDNSTSDCTGYHLGGVLEETSNQALTGDVDGTAGFDGKSTDCAATTGTEACYDITN